MQQPPPTLGAPGLRLAVLGPLGSAGVWVGLVLCWCDPKKLFSGLLSCCGLLSVAPMGPNTAVLVQIWEGGNQTELVYLLARIWRAWWPLCAWMPQNMN